MNTLLAICRIGVVVFVAGLLPGPVAIAGGLARPTREEPTHTSDMTTTIGHVAWEISEASTGKVLGAGSRAVQMNEVQVISTPGSDYLEQRIPLSADFYLKLNSGRKEKPFAGMGMAAGKEDQLTFSWEWFNIEGPDRARKLQEDGLLDIRMEKIGENYEITQTHFLSDISLRVLDRDQSSADQDPRKPTWRVKILKGSDIEWPTFAGGKVLTASEAAAWHSANPPPPSFWSSLVKVASDNTTGTTEANDSQ